MTLLELIDAYYCTAGVAKEPADWAEFGLFMHDCDCHTFDVETVREFVTSKHALLRSKDYKPGSHPQMAVVFGKTYVNDAFLGHVYEDGDKVQRVVFPGYGIHVSSTSLSEDWRYLILAVASGVDTEKAAILEVVYADKTVRGFVPVSTWEALDDIHSRLQAAPKTPTPGPLCGRCVSAHTCQQLHEFQRAYDLPPDSLKDKKQKAHRLWLVAISLRSRLKSIEELWRVVSKKLKECIEEDKININDYFYLDAQASERTSYPFGPTYSILNDSNQWKPEFGKIQVGELKKSLSEMPKEIQDKLENLKQVDMTEPALREVVHNGQQSIKTSIFAGVSGKK